MTDYRNGIEIKQSGTGSAELYRVEARTTYHSPERVGGQLIDNNWRLVDFAKAPLGVPIRNFDAGAHEHCGLLNYEAAEALRWWFLAAAHADIAAGALCIETRLVKVRYHYHYRCEELGVTEPISGIAIRRSLPVSPRIAQAIEVAEPSRPDRGSTSGESAVGNADAPVSRHDTPKES
jgi:hypothetical protein